jgi:hypothetical protein
MAAARLDDIDILATNGVLDLAARFAAGEFAKNTVARWDTEDVGDALNKLGVGVSSEENDIANPDGRIEGC